MHILILNTRLVPESKPGEESLCQKLAAQFVRMGHDVRLIAPVDFELDRLQTPLAKRLSPITVTTDGDTYTYTRFDTRTNTGVEYRLLQSKTDNPDAYGPDALGEAANQLVAGMDFTPELTIIFDHRISIKGAPENCPHTISAITDASLSDFPAVRGSSTRAEDFERVIVHGPVLAGKLLESAPDSILARTISTGKAEILPILTMTNSSDSFHKPSAKASLQTTLGLPVRDDVPLFYLYLPMAQCVDILPEILSQEIQVVCKCEAEAIAELLETYPDRLCALPSDSKDAILVKAADFCVQPNHTDKVAASLQAGTIPIVPFENNFTIVELSPDGESGTGLLYPKGDLETAIGKALGLYSVQKTFRDLSARVSHSVVSLESIANMYLKG